MRNGVLSGNERGANEEVGNMKESQDHHGVGSACAIYKGERRFACHKAKQGNRRSGPPHGSAFRCQHVRGIFDEFCMVPPSYNLDIHGGSHGTMTGHTLAEIERILLSERPDVVMVDGETNSTLAGALAAIKLLSRSRMSKPDYDLSTCQYLKR